MKKMIRIVKPIFVGLIAGMIALSACSGQPVNREPVATTPVPTPAAFIPTQGVLPGNQTVTNEAPGVSDTAATSDAVDVPTSSATNAAPITHQEIVVMSDSVENFTSVVSRLDGLTRDEKAVLTAYIAQELDLREQFTEQCIGLLSDEERAALKDMGSPPYQQANRKLEDLMQNIPACANVSKEIETLMNQNSELLIKLKTLLSPFMTQ